MPIIESRNQTVFLFDGLSGLCAAALVRLIVVWTDRRLGRNHPPLPAG
jgi:hypothetical protein